jgi:hypothetical protein
MASLQFATSAFAIYRTEPLPALDWQFEAALLPLQLASFTTTSAGPQEERSLERPNAPRCFVVAVPQGIRLRRPPLGRPQTATDHQSALLYRGRARRTIEWSSGRLLACPN